MSSPPVTRPEVVRDQVAEQDFGVVEQPLTLWERIYGNGLFRKLVILMVLAAIWEAYARFLGNPLVLPTFTSTLQTFIERIASGELVARAGTSLQVLLQGYVIGLALAFVFTVLAMSTQIGNDLLETLTAMLNPLPAIALLPLALVWFGLGSPSIIFVLIHAVMWPVALNTHSGFQSVSNTLRMVGRNYGLRGAGYVTKILVPAAFPSILSGLKAGRSLGAR
jgi:NitT/TauT family transport system permease protein